MIHANTFTYTGTQAHTLSTHADMYILAHIHYNRVNTQVHNSRKKHIHRVLWFFSLVSCILRRAVARPPELLNRGRGDLMLIFQALLARSEDKLWRGVKLNHLLCPGPDHRQPYYIKYSTLCPFNPS